MKVDDLVQLFGGRFRSDFDLLREHGFPIDGQVVPPILQGLGVIDDQSERTVFGESAGLSVMDAGVVAVDLAQTTVALQGAQVVDGGVAAIQFAQVVHLAQCIQITDCRT